jgi:hypothetical protein
MCPQGSSSAWAGGGDGSRVVALEELQAIGPDPLHLAAVFGVHATTATRYADAIRSHAEQTATTTGKDVQSTGAPLGAYRRPAVEVERRFDQRAASRHQPPPRPRRPHPRPGRQDQAVRRHGPAWRRFGFQRGVIVGSRSQLGFPA